jgi:stalled ribosome rescue protein Dom34
MTKKNMGIWMDHSAAHLMELKGDTLITSIVTCKFTHEEKEHSLGKSEHLMHNKEQHEQAEYYKKIAAIIRDCKEVVLFGPTTAKNELVNFIKDDHHFSGIKIEVKHADKMTANQQHAFVKNHFAHSIN